ncbi:NADH kinase POS5, mitochondrial [Wickerhamomyces ciferrii]|uniref:NADH kinase POS5, mitochondrial n=1 Tax=Wickerhamomyces ciferrii (strain ATCC 14091 / BCRC 22168 / CBS 111 / JCM 3599 / NBRC 0793 / NRRL Y-1031 F-60-10) TaxID=1206466 RepID=K0KC12_WICCF|nr:NADH kinase POS5, mitochondrial [Wickerhamomyces ciferrii]CCH42610.1 NADH kinase POS5, mitochondrial [Wickerhamomyces ciferrii]
MRSTMTSLVHRSITGQCRSLFPKYFTTSRNTNIRFFSTTKISRITEPIIHPNKNVEIRPVSTLRPRTHPEYIKAHNSKLENLVWRNPLQNILITKKPWSQHVRASMVEFITFLHDHYPEINVMVANDVAEEISQEFKEMPKQTSRSPHVLYTGEMSEIVPKTDLLVTLGGDGTILRGVSLFSNGRVPPVLSFSLGTLGFLLPFDFNNFKQAFKEVYTSTAKVIHRTRLECHVIRKTSKPENKDMIHAMNDIVLHRGDTPNLTTLDIYIDGEFLTRTTADGVCLSTPTGSTAYSLSSGGSIVSPLVPAIMITPICPRSLSFRPLIVPLSSHIKIKIAERQNGENDVRFSIDGVPQDFLKVEDEIHVVNEIGTIFVDNVKIPTASGEQRSILKKKQVETGVYCVAKSENDWVRGINELLGFNSSFKNQAKIKNSTKADV